MNRIRRVAAAGTPGFAIILVLAIFLAGCASVPEDQPELADSGIDIEGIIIRNGLPYVVRDVMVTVPATGSYAGCGNILPRTDCRTSFPARDYRENAVQVTWSEHGEQRNTEPFIVELPVDAVTGDIFWLEVQIYAPGLAGARLARP